MLNIISLQMLSIERAVIDALGRVWASMLLNCMAIVYSLVGLLGICVKDKPVIFLVRGSYFII